MDQSPIICVEFFLFNVPPHFSFCFLRYIYILRLCSCQLEGFSLPKLRPLTCFLFFCYFNKIVEREREEGDTQIRRYVSGFPRQYLSEASPRRDRDANLRSRFFKVENNSLELTRIFQNIFIDPIVSARNSLHVYLSSPPFFLALTIGSINIFFEVGVDGRERIEKFDICRRDRKSWSAETFATVTHVKTWRFFVVKW